MVTIEITYHFLVTLSKGLGVIIFFKGCDLCLLSSFYLKHFENKLRDVSIFSAGIFYISRLLNYISRLRQLIHSTFTTDFSHTTMLFRSSPCPLQPAINMLLNTIKGETPGSNKKKNKEKNILQRPIICICNDLYVPSLRQLRQLALVITFPPTVASKLASRLLEVGI